MVRGRQDAMSNQGAGPGAGDTQACLGCPEGIGISSLASGFHVKGSFLLNNKFWHLGTPPGPPFSYTLRTW